MNKKGSYLLAGEMVQWFFRVFALIIVLVVLALIVGAYVNQKTDVSSLEHRIIVDKVFMQRGCIGYNDGARWITNSIDANRFGDMALERCLISQDIGLKLKLSYNDIEMEARYNDFLLSYFEFCKENAGFKCSQDKMLVKVKDGEEIFDGVVEYEVITRDK